MCGVAKPTWKRAVKITFLPLGWGEWKIKKKCARPESASVASFGSLAISRVSRWFPACFRAPTRPAPSSGGRPEGWVMLQVLSRFRNMSHIHPHGEWKTERVRNPDRAGTSAAPRVVLFLFYWGGARDREGVSLPASPLPSKGGIAFGYHQVIFKHRSTVSNPYRLLCVGFHKGVRGWRARADLILPSLSTLINDDSWRIG